MNAIITGDVVESRKIEENWLKILKEALTYVTDQGCRWELFRGDSFQAEVLPEKAFISCLYIKASLKTIKDGDVRMGIGIGNVDTVSSDLSESNGPAFIFSGGAFDTLKEEKINLIVRSGNGEFDKEINLYIKFALTAMDNWGVATAEIVKLALEHKEMSQTELGEISGRSQSTISEGLKRARYSELMELDSLFREKLKTIIK